MYVARTFRMSAAAVAAVLTVGTFGATAAHARPAAAPTGLAATVAGHPDGSYDVAASWNANSKATSYRVTLTKGGATLASAKVPDNSWSPTITATPGTASLNVRTLIGKKPGRTATFSFTLPDVVAPTGTFVSSKDEIAKL